MDIKNQEQALKLQEEFRARLLQTVETLRKGKAPSVDAIVADNASLIARTQSRLDNAVKARDAALRHWDERIARLKEELQRLEAQTRDIKERRTKPEREPAPLQRPKTRARKKTPR
jgi:hypothetical protein